MGDNTTIIIPPSDGHIDLPDGMADTTVGMSMEVYRDPETGYPVIVLHMDAYDDEDGWEWSIGIAMDGGVVEHLTSMLTLARTMASGAARDRLN